MSSREKETKEIKVILLGESGVGKSSIISRYINNEFTEHSQSTLGSNFYVKEINKENTIYKLNIWDTSGQERYHSITNLFLKGSSIIILVYAINSRSSFKGLEYWYNTINEYLSGENHILAIVGNKSDLLDDEVISEEEGKKYAKEKNAIFKLVSAKSFPEGIFQLFQTVFDELLKNNYDLTVQSIAITKRNPRIKKKKKCC